MGRKSMKRLLPALAIVLPGWGAAETFDCSQPTVVCVDDVGVSPSVYGDSGTTTAEFTSIDAAVDSGLSAGVTVVVYPGTYTECVSIADSLQGAPTNPISLRARFPARRPLNGTLDWADQAGKRARIAAKGCVGGIYNAGYSGPVRYWIVDGFYISDGATAAPSRGGGIFFQNDNDIWIRNNYLVNGGLDAHSENYGTITIEFGGNVLIQNNYAELSRKDQIYDSPIMSVHASDAIVELNELYFDMLNGSGRHIYAAATSVRFVEQYNYTKAMNRGHSQFGRHRDHNDNTFMHNVIVSLGAPQFEHIFHQNGCGPLTGWRHDRNTVYYEQGSVSSGFMFGLGGLSGATANGNVLVSGQVDNDSAPLGNAFLCWPASATADGNLFWNYVSLVVAPSTNYVETNTLRADPGLNVATGCIANYDNKTYGADLDVGRFPWRKCSDATFYPCSSYFGHACQVVDGSGRPVPSAPTNLRVF